MYKIILTKTASKFLKTVPKNDQEKIMQRIKQLSDNPRNEDVIKLTNVNPNTYRTRQGNYRIFFHIFDHELFINVIEIDHRKDAYKN